VPLKCSLATEGWWPAGSNTTRGATPRHRRQAEAKTYEVVFTLLRPSLRVPVKAAFNQEPLTDGLGALVGRAAVVGKGLAPV
jgi:hypothetical protein